MEMMVAVSITVLMMMATSVVFKSAGAAAGKANAYSEMMQQVRALCRQLENDFKGLRPDMPMAVIFEGHTNDIGDSDPDRGDPDEPLKVVRYDRIVFFANGDFQTNDYNTNDSISGNIARIFYGQAEDLPPIPPELAEPPRQILTRRFNIMTANQKNWTGFANTLPVDIDFNPMDYCSSTQEWKNFLDFHTNYETNFFVDDPAYGFSIIRRSIIEDLADYIEGTEGMQRIYMLPDVTDFKIEFWGQPQLPSDPTWRWFPFSTELYSFCQTATGGPLRGYAFCWNTPKPVSFPMDIDGIRWFWLDANLGQAPKAIRFTFTLYDRNRRYYPEGRTFTYIVKLPRRT